MILIMNVLKVALNNFRGHITAKDCLRRPKSMTFFLSFTLVYSRPMQVGTDPGYAINCKFGFDFGFWAKLI